ncbi:MAG TPA: hypothetical protein VLC08_11330, partial [Chitinolyticbacter sp.]|nr:hypothetical protein [Chitinolyticbacter sp.]
MTPPTPSSFVEALRCVALGLRDALHPALITLSLGVWLLALLVMSAIYIAAWSWLLPAMHATAQFAVLGLPGQLGWAPQAGGTLAQLAAYAQTALQWTFLALLFVVG